MESLLIMFSAKQTMMIKEMTTEKQRKRTQNVKQFSVKLRHGVDELFSSSYRGYFENIIDVKLFQNAASRYVFLFLCIIEDLGIK